MTILTSHKIDFRPYVGVPYRDRGRDFDGIDCWGIPFLIYRDEAEISLPEYGEISAHDLLAIAREIGREQVKSDQWRRLGNFEVLRSLDLVVMSSADKPAKIPHHIGVMMDEQRLVHAEQGRDSHVSRLNDQAIATRVIGFYRHAKLEAMR